MKRGIPSTESQRRVLVVNDERPIRSAIETLLRKKGYRWSSAETRSEAVALIEEERPDLVITDLNLEHRDDGLEIIRLVRSLYPTTAVLVMTGYGDGESPTAAMKAGAYDFIEKPFGSIRELEATIEAALARNAFKGAGPEVAFSRIDPFEHIIGGDPELLDLFSVIQRLSDTDATVLLVGESGTGKELFARAIHASSKRSEAAFVPVNCGSIPASLLESELFGSRKGAFTGANADRKGRFQAAERGTLFLDEIGEMPVALQVTLLRVLQSREIQAVGAPEPVPVDVRVIAATNLDLERAVAEGRFREDLFYRLNVIPMRVPPLRERPGDVMPIAHHHIQRFNARMGRAIEGIDDEAASLMLTYAWPGNVRELENMIERIVILKGRGTITARDLPMKIRGDSAGTVMPLGHSSDLMASSSRELPALGGPPGQAGVGPPLASLALRLALPAGGIDLRRFVEHVEQQLIEAAMKEAQGNRAQAARLLGLNRTTLVERLKRGG